VSAAGPRAFADVALAVARRNLRHAFGNPALLVPSIIFPLIFLMAFAGGLSSVDEVPGFDYSGGYTAFQFIFVLLQSAAFGGLFTGFAVARDYETGFARRLLLAAPQRSGILAGLVLAGMARFALTGSLVAVAAVLAGMEVGGTASELLALVALALLVNVVATLFSLGAFYRVRSLQAGPAVQIPIFVTLFLAPVYVPLDLLDGWVHAVASVNPATALLDAGRGYVAGEPADGLLAFACAAGLIAVTAVWARTGLRRAERAG
jgi:ABC-2 type transport system permease protein